jgi:predicted neutral ceramidase superfamily lipid hydrolase
VGVSRIVPDEWKLEDGMGPCGIATLIVKPENGNAFAYVVMDGNNMISGVREIILSELKSRESIEAELLTSDTHMVNAIGATTRGYYPLGERTEKERLIEYVVRSTEEASSKMTECSASHSSMVIPELTVLGENGLNLISEVLESAFNTFKNVAIVSVTSSLILAVATVFFL